MEAVRSVGRQGGTLDLLHVSRRALFVVAVGIALVFGTSAAHAAPASAQGVYGGSPYGSKIYGATSEEEEVLPPNTGFQMLAGAAHEQPVLFWGSSVAIVLALVGGAVAVRGIVKHKQEK